jgi:DUF971 family protein
VSEQPWVVDVDVQRAEAVTITYSDGMVCRFAVGDLRAACPCASCRGWRERGEVAWPRPGAPDAIEIAHAELVGAWGISFVWSDGHEAGIFPWDRLRDWCEDAENGAPLPG